MASVSYVLYNIFSCISLSRKTTERQRHSSHTPLSSFSHSSEGQVRSGQVKYSSPATLSQHFFVISQEVYMRSGCMCQVTTRPVLAFRNDLLAVSCNEDILVRWLSSIRVVFSDKLQVSRLNNGGRFSRFSLVAITHTIMAGKHYSRPKIKRKKKKIKLGHLTKPKTKVWVTVFGFTSD